MKPVERKFNLDSLRRPTVDFSTCTSLTEVLNMLTERGGHMMKKSGEPVDCHQLARALVESFYALANDRRNAALLNNYRVLPQFSVEDINRVLAEYGITREYGLRSTMARLINCQNVLEQLTVDIRTQFHLD